jgi:hypothetical protein
MAASSRIPAPRISSDETRPRATRGRTPVAAGPLGSLTQRDHRPASTCRDCGSAQVTVLTMSLTDGTPVQFTSCHRCEHRTWEHAGDQLSVAVVLERSRKD